MVVKIKENDQSLEKNEISEKKEAAAVQENITPNIEYIKNTCPEKLKADLRDKLDKIPFASEQMVEKRALIPEEIKKMRAETGWSENILKQMKSIGECKVYKNANLEERIINGKECLIRTDIDWNQKDALGRTNKERVDMGLSPLDNNGVPVELHHIGQHNNSPLAELKKIEHMGNGNNTILHDTNKTSEIDREKFADERREHWQNRVEILGDKK